MDSPAPRSPLSTRLLAVASVALSLALWPLSALWFVLLIGEELNPALRDAYIEQKKQGLALLGLVIAGVLGLGIAAGWLARKAHPVTVAIAGAFGALWALALAWLALQAML